MNRAEKYKKRRELILTSLVRGLSDAEIAEAVQIGDVALHTCIGRLVRKQGVGDRFFFVKSLMHEYEEEARQLGNAVHKTLQDVLYSTGRSHMLEFVTLLVTSKPGPGGGNKWYANQLGITPTQVTRLMQDLADAFGCEHRLHLVAIRCQAAHTYGPGLDLSPSARPFTARSIPARRVGNGEELTKKDLVLLGAVFGRSDAEMAAIAGVTQGRISSMVSSFKKDHGAQGRLDLAKRLMAQYPGDAQDFGRECEALLTRFFDSAPPEAAWSFVQLLADDNGPDRTQKWYGRQLRCDRRMADIVHSLAATFDCDPKIYLIGIRCYAAYMWT